MAAVFFLQASHPANSVRALKESRSCNLTGGEHNKYNHRRLHILSLVHVYVKKSPVCVEY